MTKKIFAALAMSAIVASLLVGCKASDAPDTTTPPADAVTKTGDKPATTPVPPQAHVGKPDATSTK